MPRKKDAPEEPVPSGIGKPRSEQDRREPRETPQHRLPETEAPARLAAAARGDQLVARQGIEFRLVVFLVAGQPVRPAVLDAQDAQLPFIDLPKTSRSRGLIVT